MPGSAPAAKTWVELDVLGGLQPLLRAELEDRFPGRLGQIDSSDGEALTGSWRGALDDLLALRTVVAASILLSFPVPRPRGLLGDQHFRRLLGALAGVQSRGGGGFTALRVSAAGARSAVLQRLATALGEAIGLPVDPDGGDLLLRLRRSVVLDGGWDVLVRLTPRPLSTRGWRVIDYPGALNATVAAAMVRLSDPLPTDRVINAMCGSGTLLIERAAHGPAAALIGYDNAEAALSAARSNAAAADAPGIVVEQRDGVASELPTGSADVLLCDLPWGQRMGSHHGNESLYPQALREMARLVRRGGRLILVSHEILLMERTLASNADLSTESVLRVDVGGYHPRVYVLRRN